MKSKSQVEIDKIILNFLGDFKIEVPDDLITLKDSIHKSLEFRPYNKQTKDHADSIQWKRTASEIIKDGYVYNGKACSDLTIVFLALCKACGIEGRLVKLISIDKKKTHSIAEIKFNGEWYRINVSARDSKLFKGELTGESIWNKEYKVWKKGRDVWDLELYNINSENNFLEE